MGGSYVLALPELRLGNIYRCPGLVNCFNGNGRMIIIIIIRIIVCVLTAPVRLVRYYVVRTKTIYAKPDLNIIIIIYFSRNRTMGHDPKHVSCYQIVGKSQLTDNCDTIKSVSQYTFNNTT